MIGKFCVVRTYSAGVHCGTVESMDGKIVTLRDARRIWRWRGANTLNELATIGCSETAFTRISAPVDHVVLTEAIEVLHTTDAARSNLEKSRWL